MNIFFSLYGRSNRIWRRRKLEKGPYNTAAGIKRGWGDFKIDVGSLQVLHGWWYGYNVMATITLLDTRQCIHEHHMRWTDGLSPHQRFTPFLRPIITTVKVSLFSQRCRFLPWKALFFRHKAKQKGSKPNIIIVFYIRSKIKKVEKKYAIAS